MATTFTGLKLQGEIGRFGRTEISDICGKRQTGCWHCTVPSYDFVPDVAMFERKCVLFSEWNAIV